MKDKLSGGQRYWHKEIGMVVYGASKKAIQ